MTVRRSERPSERTSASHAVHAEDLIPAGLRETMSARDADVLSAPHERISGADWLARLPRIVTDALSRWELSVDGPSRYGSCGLAVPVRRGSGRTSERCVLKVTWPHREARHEHLALRTWAGHGAVRLLAAHPDDWTLLLARLDADRDLGGEPIDEACTRIGLLLRSLDRPALPQLDLLSGDLARLRERITRGEPRVPRRFLDQAASLITTRLGEPATDSRLVHTDLHYANVLARHPRDPLAPGWVAIDPKPLAAHPAYAVWPALHNRWDEVLASGDARWEIHLRLGWICEAAGLDEDDAREWALIRTVQDALWLADEDAAAARHGRSTGADAALSARITLLKALQPSH